jgi:E3 ubiquitin-protein ligase RNF139
LCLCCLQDEESAEWLAHQQLATWVPFCSSFALDSRAVVLNYVVQAAVGLMLGSILNFHYVSPSSNPNLLMKSLVVSLLSPNFFAMYSALPSDALDLSVALSLVLPSLLTLYALWSVLGSAIYVTMQSVKSKRQFVANFGLNTFLEAEWSRIRVPSLLRMFWLTRVGLHLCGVVFEMYASAGEQDGVLAAMSDQNMSDVMERMQVLGKDLLTRGSETLLAVLGMTSIVSTMCHYVGIFFHMLLRQEDEEEKSVASVSAVLFFVLALQCGLTSLEPDKRFARLCKNFFLLLTALFHIIHNIVSPVLMSLSASHNYNGRKHVRALAICAFLVTAPVALMIYLWGAFSAGTWLFAVSAFCFEVIVKVTVTVCVYTLFLYDQWYKEGTWEMLDDSVYYVKALGNSVEFCFAVFLFFNGGWILIFESGGTIRAVMMLIHAYCNIWCEAKSGWSTFIKRRTAVSKINCLPEATSEQLQLNADVCAICYQDMLTAKLTRCNHFFHGICLRKWLYVQDTCPLCHTPLADQERQQLQLRQQPGLQRRQRRRRIAGEMRNVADDDLIDNDVVDSSSSSDSEDGDDQDNMVVGGVVVDGVAGGREGAAGSGGLSSSDESSRPGMDMDLIYDSMEEWQSDNADDNDVDDDEDDDDARETNGFAQQDI